MESEPATLEEPVETIKVEPGGAPLVQKVGLRVLAGPDTGAVFAADVLEIAIGTHPSCQLVLTDPTVSRFHCRLTLEATGARLRDLGSRNGTQLGGITVVEAVLRHGATITLGNTQVRLDFEGQQVPIPLSSRERFGRLVGGSAAMRGVFALLERCAACDSTVLLLGDTGTGKEAAAESIHRASARKDAPFVVVDCGAIPRELLESELFGHQRGAFTGALAARPGAFELAACGTVFLDEIGELDVELQTRLLRVLERREVKRLGGTRFATVDVRVVAATNRDLRADVNTRRFRSDLYYRLAVLEVRLPALRERLEDLRPLVDELLAELPAGTAPGSELLRSPELIADLARHPWPGNVRELRNYLERCLALHERMPLAAPELTAGPQTDARQPFKQAREQWLAAFEKQYLEDLLRRHGGSVAAAARAAGVARVYLYRLLWRHELR